MSHQVEIPPMFGEDFGVYCTPLAGGEGSFNWTRTQNMGLNLQKSDTRKIGLRGTGSRQRGRKSVPGSCEACGRHLQLYWQHPYFTTSACTHQNSKGHLLHFFA